MGVTLNLWDSFNIYYRFLRSVQHLLRGMEPQTLRTYTSQRTGVSYVWRWSNTELEYVDIDSTDIPTEEWKATEILSFRPARKVYFSFSASIGEIRFKKLTSTNDVDRYQAYKARYHMELTRRGNFRVESYLNKRKGVANITEEKGVKSLFEWFYNIYSLDVSYDISDHEDKVSGESFINHLFKVTIKRKLF